MYKFSLFFLALIFINCCNGKESPKGNESLELENQNKINFIQVSELNPRYLSYSDGTPYIPIGPNICFPRFEKDEKKVMALMEERFKNLSENGGNYTRIWLSAPFYEIEDENAGEYNPVKINRIDKLMELASKYGIKIKFCFEHFRELINRPASFEGSVPFDRPIYHVSNGGALKNMTEFFESEKGKELYINRMQVFSEKYSSNPDVYGWELWNEIISVSAKYDLYFAWTKEMFKKAHELFPNQLVMQSIGSLDNKHKISAYKDFFQLEENNVNQVHRYLDTGAGLEVCRGPMDVLSSDAVKTLLSFSESKPIILAEVGAVEAHHASPSKLYKVDTLGILLHDLLFTPFFSGAAGPGQSWHWFYYVEKNDLWFHFNRFARAIEGVNPIEEEFVPLFSESNDLRIYQLKGEKTAIAWCRDKNSDWQTELIEKVEPKSLNLSVSLSQLNIVDKKIEKVSIYDPWKDQWSEGKLTENEISIPAFSRSIVVKISYK